MKACFCIYVPTLLTKNQSLIKRTFQKRGNSYLTNQDRSSRPEAFCKKACNFIKKESLAQVFSCEFCEILRALFFNRTLLVAAFVNIE